MLAATPALRIFLNSVILLRSSGLTARMGEQLVKNIVYLVPIFVQCGHLKIPADYLNNEDEEKEARENGEEKQKEKTKEVLLWMFDRLWAMSWKKGNVKVKNIL